MDLFPLEVRNSVSYSRRSHHHHSHQHGTAELETLSSDLFGLFFEQNVCNLEASREKLYRMHPSKSSKTYYGFVTQVALETLFHITSAFRLRGKFNLLNVYAVFGKGNI